MKQLKLWEHVIAYITLGLLCGWYQFVLVIVPLLSYFAYRGSYIAGAILCLGIALTWSPLRHEPWPAFTRLWIWRIWRDYFDLEYENSLKLEKGKKYIFFEFPHGIFPMGQFLSASVVEECFPHQKICGTAANVVFMFPVMRQIMAWIGTFPASRASISKIFRKGFHAAIIPGGIAEMYLVNPHEEGIYFTERLKTVKVAIQEGANIIPVFFFGNSLIFHALDGQDSNSWISKISRKIRASLFFFYGRQGLPVPFRHPLKMAAGDIIEVIQKENPSDEEVSLIHSRVVEAVKKLYDTKKPAWETRPLVIK